MLSAGPRQGFREWATPAAVLLAGLAVCATTAWGDAAGRREQQRTKAAVERVEMELVGLRAERR